MKRKQCALAVMAALWGSNAAATNGDQMLGVTATQWGMAGAVVAAPQDAGTVLTNPAGLATLDMNEFRADMGFGFLNPPRKAGGVESDSDLYLIPSGALAYRVNDRLTVGMGMAGLSGMGVDFPAGTHPTGGAVVTTKQFYKIAPGFGYRVNDRLSIGAALNINYQSLAMYAPLPGGEKLPQNQVYGFGAGLGLIYRVNDRFQVGASYITEQHMDEFTWNTDSGTYRMEMNAPAQFTIGAAWMPRSDLLIEADVKHIAFSDVLDSVNLQFPGGTVAMPFGWDDQTVFAIGVQKQINPKLTVRAGYNYGKSPIGSEDVLANIGSLAVTEHHLSLGLTRQLGNRLFGSLSYVRAFNNEVTAPTGYAIELEQNIVNLQITYRN